MSTTEPEPQLIDLREFVGVIRRRWLTVALVTVAVMAVALGLVARRSPVYTSTARVEVRPLTAEVSLYGSFYDLQAAMDTEAQRVSSQPIAEEAATAFTEAGGEPTDPQTLAGSVDVTVPANTTYLDISCTMPSPEEAQMCAEAFADAYVDERTAQARAQYESAAAQPLAQIEQANKQLQALSDDLVATEDPVEQARIEEDMDAAQRMLDTARLQLLTTVPAPSPSPALVAVPADLPLAPANKSYVTTGILAFIVGLALGIGLAFVRERLDERVTDREHFERAVGAPVLSIVPRVPGWRNRTDAKVVSVSAPDSAGAEAYRTARTALLYLAREGGLQVMAVTGPGMGEGKTTTTANLAVTLAQGGKRVVAVSCDLRKPRMHRFFGVSNEVGLSNILRGEASLVDGLLKTEVPNLVLLPSGHVPHDPAELLASDAMDELIAQLRKIADFVLLDTPPALVVADALGLVTKVDGVLVIADASKTNRSALVYARTQIERAGGDVIGGVLNNLDPGAAKRTYYGSYTYEGGERYKTPTNGSSNGHSNGSNGKAPRGRKARKQAEAASGSDAGFVG